MSDNTLVGSWVLEADLEVSGSKWKNSQALTGIGAGVDNPPTTSDAIIVAWQQFIQAVHYNDVTLDQIVLRQAIQHVGTTPGVETPPVWTLPVNAACTGNATYGSAQNSNYLPKDVVLFVKKGTTGGRSGKNFMRNILTEVDVASSLSGEWSFTPGAGHFDPAVFNAAVVAILAGYMTNPPGSGNYYLSVLHLMHVKTGDTRLPYSTLMSSMLAEKPAWNKATR